MKYALVNGERQEAKSGLLGICEVTGLPVIAKCGTERSPHWALIGERELDSWWEPETPWHREWKDKFPKEWREVFHPAENGTGHRADVKTDQGLVIEFQHSDLDRQDRVARERFYPNMVWVVDGTRLKRDYPRFLEKRKDFIAGHQQGFFLVHFPEECFPTAWVESSVMVIFDFQGTLPLDPNDGMRNALWCLLPGRTKRCALMVAISRQTFITTTTKQPRLLPDPLNEYLSAYDKRFAQQEEIRDRQTRIQGWPSRKPLREIIPKRGKRN